MAKGSDQRSGDPTEPGWYPDPWSATGEGERYFDGKRWGTNEKPLGRHTVATREPGDRADPGRFRRAVVPVVVLVVLVGAYFAVSRMNGDDSGDGAAPGTGTPARENAPPRSDGAATEPLGVPAPVPAGTGGYEFLDHQPGAPDTPIAFDPCRPVHYVVNPAGAPADGDARIRRAIERVSTATGLQFVDDGDTTEVPAKRRDPYQPDRYDRSRWAPVLIAWSDEASNPQLAGYIAGVTSPDGMMTEHGNVVYVTGQVVLDREQLADDSPEAGATILHELGHLVGLDHTSDRTQVMFSETQPGVTDFADGDLRGLAALGTQSCFPGV